MHFVYSRMMLTVVLPFSTNWLWIRSRGGPENCISLLVRHGLGSRFMVLAHVLWSGSRFMVLAHVHVLWSWLTVMVMAHVVWTWLTFLVLAHVLWSCHTFYVIAQVLWSWFMFYGHAIRFMSYWCFMVMAHVLWPWLILYDHWQILHDPWLSFMTVAHLIRPLADSAWPMAHVIRTLADFAWPKGQGLQWPGHDSPFCITLYHDQDFGVASFKSFRVLSELLIRV